MPNLNPGIKPQFGSGRHYVFLLATVLFPFLLRAQPTITSFAPLSGPVGSTVTVTGSNFGAAPSDNIVYFGAVRAAVTAASATSLTVTVPTGASYQPLTVTTGGLTAFSARPFNLTFSDPGQFMPDAFQRRDITSGSNPYYICAKDLDGDGKIDFGIVTNRTFVVYSNISTPGFLQFSALTAVTPDAGTFPLAITAGDLDGDGKPELVVALMDGHIYVYKNTSTAGTITFTTSPLVLTGGSNVSSQYSDLVIADFNGDGKPDIGTFSTDNGSLSVYGNTSTPGNLSFPSKTDLPLVSGGFPTNLVAGDLDGDGMPDLACTNYGGSVSVFRNTATPGGAVSFDAESNIAVNADGTAGLAAGDLDGDGKIDLVNTTTSAADGVSGSLNLLHNTSNSGTISFSVIPNSNPTIITPWSIAINDLDGDGMPDITVAAQNSQSVSVHRNISTSGAISLSSLVHYSTGFSPWGLSIADLDGDGQPDLAVVDNGSSAVTILRNKKPTDIAITSFTPAVGTTGTTVTITGANFSATTSVSFGGTQAAAFAVVSPTTITAIVGAGSSGDVLVSGSASYDASAGFTYNLVPPTISSFSPMSGGAGTIVLIEGSGFVSNAVSAVSFGGSPAQITGITDTEITAVVGGGATGEVEVTYASGSASRSGFTYTIVGPPTITSFSPLSAVQGTDITITGTNLSNITAVTFGGTPAQSFRIISDNIVHATVAGGTTGSVNVTSPIGTGSYPGFTFLTAPPPPAPPTITSFSPKSAYTGTSITIKGTNLSAVTVVTFGGAEAVSVNPLNDSVLQAVVGLGASGSVKVASALGLDSLAGFVYLKDSVTTPSTPFQLVVFSGTVTNNQPRLTWQTRNDGAISFYAVERSIDGSQFSVVGTVPVNNKTTGNHTYTFADAGPKNGVNYYRIKMQDSTTHYTYSSAIALQLSGPIMAIYPNPVKYGFFLADLPSSANASWFRLTDMNGRVVQTLAVPAGTIQVRINVPGLPRGTYRLAWTDGSLTAYQSILIL